MLLCSRSKLSRSDLAVFDIIKRNYSQLLYSNLPMKDFYYTVPLFIGFASITP